MLAKIGESIFELNEADIQSISHSVTIGWNRSKRIGTHEIAQKDGTWEESVTFEGRLVLKSIDTLKNFEEEAKAGKPLRITLGSGESFEAVIESYSKTKSGFFKDGAYRYQSYSITIKRYFR